MQEIKDDLRAIRADISEIKIDVARNTESLDHHIKRTDLLERILLIIIGAIVTGFLGIVVKVLVS
jgi:hypothetical protein